jgi:hypothetical protein
MHSHGDKMAIVHMHLRHVEDCTAATAREKHYDALGGEARVRFLRSKAQQEYDKHRRMCKITQPTRRPLRRSTFEYGMFAIWYQP